MRIVLVFVAQLPMHRTAAPRAKEQCPTRSFARRAPVRWLLSTTSNFCCTTWQVTPQVAKVKVAKSQNASGGRDTRFRIRQFGRLGFELPMAETPFAVAGERRKYPDFKGSVKPVDVGDFGRDSENRPPTTDSVITMSLKVSIKSATP